MLGWLGSVLGTAAAVSTDPVFMIGCAAIGFVCRRWSILVVALVTWGIAVDVIVWLMSSAGAHDLILRPVSRTIASIVPSALGVLARQVVARRA